MMELSGCPPEIWYEIFALACTDTGLTGRSLSLVSKQFHDISGPFKYQCLAITQWRQLVAFAELFPQLPDSQRKIKYLFIHCPYPFLHVEDNPRIASERPRLEALEYFEKDRRDNYQEGLDSDSDSDYLVGESDSESDSVREEQMFSESESDSGSDSELGSLDRDEEQEVLEDVQYLQAVHESSLPTEGKTREDESGVLDYNIQAVFDKAIQALHAILNETSSTLKILTLYWTSFKPLPIHEILPPLPFLEELHLFRCSIIVEATEYDYSSTTVLFPRLRLFFKSGDRHHRSLICSIAAIAPNLTHFRFTQVTYQHELWTNDRFMGDSIVRTSQKCATDVVQTLVNGKKSDLFIPIMGYIGEMPESWQFLWSSRVAGRVEGWTAG